ncbi:putative bifunctional diguanylate cyclase/phosphodiesterase [Paraferrimonas sedimenticola]|uniref:Diguanylate cyclase (GGDEF) domain-containing protein n=1 Tax=Paraferrimonas sedimenticola TaxID=375674 RepID=A0AA37RV16_9GAMM|nr:EAL domain-containing protein [Paraferrimonas sedimenticola]GLP95901.1 hypothetical protein GCM10007895_12070 [Paraferrimonas sedimenticola]
MSSGVILPLLLGLAISGCCFLVFAAGYLFSENKRIRAQMTKQTQNNRDAIEKVQLQFNAIPAALLEVDGAGRIEKHNAKAVALLAPDRSDLTSLNLNQLLPLMEGDFSQQVSDYLEGKNFNDKGRIRIRSYKGPRQLSYHFGLPTVPSQTLLIYLRDVTQDVNQHSQAQMTTIDEVTQVYNRYAFESRLRQLSNTPGLHSVLYLDLEKFKLINENCGHQVGDRMLRMVAFAIQTALADVPHYIARMSGDEFAVLLSQVEQSEVEELLKRIRQIVREQRLSVTQGVFKVGVSIGAAFAEGPLSSPLDLLKDAETSCDAAKKKGSSQIDIFDPTNTALALNRNASHWAQQIKLALQNDDVVLYAQTIAPISRQQKSIRMEVLLRVIQEDGKVLPPAQFIASAERFKLMTDVDKVVIRRAFEWLGEQKPLWPALCVSINLSGSSLGSDGLMEFILALQKRYGFPSDCVCFEVTETSAVQNEQAAFDMMRQLRKKGFTFALDDFGSGFASYGYLSDMPVDYVKIDGRFVKNMDRNPQDLAIVRSVHDVCKVMGKKTVAEFVENKDIIERLKNIGVHYAQGYAIGKPVPLEEILSKRAATLKAS